MFHTILARGMAYDGTGAEPVEADIGIRNGRIADIGDLGAAESEKRIELDGLAVATGFIDLHTHSDFTLMADGRAESQVHQGVTTEVIGQCGFSSAPARRPEDVKGCCETNSNPSPNGQ